MFRKILYVSLALLAVLLLALTLLASPVAKYYIEKKSPELIGRQLTVGKLRLNLWGGSLRATDLHLSEADMESDFVTLDSLYVDMNLFRLLRKEVCLKHIWLVNPEVNILQYDSLFNFSDLLQLASSDDNADDAPSGWGVGLYDIRLKDGSLVYTDQPRQSSWKLKNLKINIPGVYFSGRATDVGLAFDFPDGGHLSTKLNYEISSNNYKLDLTLAGAKLDLLLPYLRDYLTVESLGGTLGGDLSVAGNLDDITTLSISGRVGVDTLDVRYFEGRQALSLAHTHACVKSIQPFKNLYDIDSVMIDGLSAEYVLFADRLSSLDRLLVEADTNMIVADTVPDKITAEVEGDTIVLQHPVVRIGHSLLKNSRFKWIDSTLYSPMEYEVTNVRAEAMNFSLDGTNEVRAYADLQEGGNLVAHWRGGLDMTNSNQRMSLSVRNLQLNHISPYAEYYVGNKITDGRLVFVSENTIVNGRLNGTNKIDIYNCQVSKKNKSLKAEYANVPLRMAVSLLKDINGKIVFNVPVSGDINSPKFSYRKIVWRTVSNIMIKAAASPFLSLAHSSGKADGNIDMVQIDPLQPEFTSMQYEKFAQILDVINAETGFAFSLSQQFNLQQAMNARAVFMLKRDFYKESHTLSEHLMLSDVDNIKAIKNNDKVFLSYVNALGVSGNNLQEKAFNHYGREAVKAEVMKMAEWRNKILAYYLRQGLKVPEKNIQVLTVPDDELNAYTGTSCYKVEAETIEDIQE